ncbi:MAG: 30S ribosomal protein S3 [Desulfuromonas sp. SDB]|nr:MAG: 30S ribosomal protein S3 [Desulfuromonas sp. SDB]
MGQKTHPVGFRMGIIKNWESRWFDPHRNFAEGLKEDIEIRKYLDKRLAQSNLSKVEIEKTSESVTITIHTSTPGRIIGRKGQEINQLREELKTLIKKEVQVRIQEVQHPETDAKLVADNIAKQLVQRVSFRRAMKRAVSNALRQGAKGIKVACAGRLGGAEIARTEWYREGQVPLHTLRADIDYAQSTANTLSGTIGVKVWVFKNMIMEDEDKYRLNLLGLTGSAKKSKKKRR